MTTEDNIQKDFETYQVAINENHYPDATLWHYLGAWMLFISGWVLLWFYMPLIPHTEFWKIVNETCCHQWYNLTVCSFNESCGNYLKSWLEMRETNFSIFQKCCYWVGKYNSSLLQPSHLRKICLAECMF